METRQKYTNKCQYNCWNEKVLPGKNTQGVNKQNICCKNCGFVYAVSTYKERW